MRSASPRRDSEQRPAHDVGRFGQRGGSSVARSSAPLCIRAVLALVAVLVCGVVASTPANASLLPNLLPGVLGPADTASSCTGSTKPFSPWGDSSYYMLMPGGSFESGPAWSLSRGAKVVSGNEPYDVNGSGSKSLYLPAGGSATTPSMCYGGDKGKLRFFVKGTGTMHVEVIVKSLTGTLLSTLNAVLDGGTISGTGSWTPSPQVMLGLNQLGGSLVTDSISFRFVADSGSWQI